MNCHDNLQNISLRNGAFVGVHERKQFREHRRGDLRFCDRVARGVGLEEGSGKQRPAVREVVRKGETGRR